MIIQLSFVTDVKPLFQNSSFFLHCGPKYFQETLRQPTDRFFEIKEDTISNFPNTKQSVSLLGATMK